MNVNIEFPPLLHSPILLQISNRGVELDLIICISQGGGGGNKVCIIFSQEYDFDALSIRIAILNYQKIHRILTCIVNSFLLILAAF